MLTQDGGRDRSAQNNHRFDYFAPFRIGATERHRFEYRWVCEEGLVDLSRRDLLTATIDQLLQTTLEAEITVRG
jgi:hypothetical protein